MKTKSFRKLSFVLAVAMILSVFYPAAGVFAASKPKLNATSKTLLLAVDGRDEFDFNIKNKKSGWAYEWESSDTDVAEVDDKGLVTAVGVGSATITVYITDKKTGEEVKELSAKVTVKDNIKTVKISNAPEGNKLAVGQEYDFNRSYVTNSGSTKKTTSITRWEVTPAENAKIDDRGLFVANAAGEYTITARSFQSKAKYEAWLADKEANAAYVLAEDSIKITVAPSMVEVKQKDLDTITVTFDSAMKQEDLAKNLKVYYLAGTTKVLHQISAITLDSTNKVATVDFYGKLVKDTTYVVEYPDMESKEFKSAAAKYTDVVSGEILTKTAQIATPEKLEIALYDKNGVNIADNNNANDALLNRVELKSSNNATTLVGRNLSMYKVGDTTTISVTYHTYDYDLTTGQEIGVVIFEGVVTCVEKKTDNVGVLNAYTVVTKSGTTKQADISNVKHSIAAGDSGYYLAVQLKGKKADGTDLYTTNVDNDAGFKYVTSNKDILIVGEYDGLVYPVREGTASVVVSYNDVVVGTAVITVVGARKVANVTLDATSFKLSNDGDVKDTKSVTVTVKDQLGDDYTNCGIETTINGNINDHGLLTSVANANPIVFNAANVPQGTYTYTVKVTDYSTWTTTTRFISVTVLAPSSDDNVYYYAVEPDKTEYDMNLTSWDTNENVTLSLFGYASNGVRNVRVDLTQGDYKVTVKTPYGNKYGNYTAAGVTKLDTVTGQSVAVLKLVNTVQDDKDPRTPKKTIFTKLETGTYIIEAVDASGKAINATYFTVKDTQAAPSLKVNKLYTDKTNLVDAVNDCFDFVVNGQYLDVEYLIDENYAGDVAHADGSRSALIKNVYVYEEITTGSYIRHNVTVNAVITYNFNN